MSNIPISQSVAYHSLPFSADLLNSLSYAYNPLFAFMAV